MNSGGGGSGLLETGSYDETQRVWVSEKRFLINKKEILTDVRGEKRGDTSSISLKLVIRERTRSIKHTDGTCTRVII